MNTKGSAPSAMIDFTASMLPDRIITNPSPLQGDALVQVFLGVSECGEPTS